MPGWFESLAVWLENTQAATSVRQSLWLYPVIQVIHIVGIVVLVGPAMIFDMRLLGFAGKLSVYDVKRYTIPLSKIGFIITVVSGFSLFIAHATDWVVNPLFWLKIFFILLAVINAVLFSKYTIKKIGRHEADGLISNSARISGTLSLLFWLLIIIAGRFLAYY